MAAPVSLGIGGIDTAAIGNAAYNGGYATATVMLYLMVLFGVLCLVGFLLYKRTFNIAVTILDNTKGGVIEREGFRGKLTQVRPGEFKFKIWKAKSYNLRYNQESFTTEHLMYIVKHNGKLRPKLYMTFDSETQLIPSPIGISKVKVPLLDELGNQRRDENGVALFTESAKITAAVDRVDIGYIFNEMDKSVEVFDHRSFWDKNGFLVLVICLILTLGVFGYTAYKLSEAATKMGDVVSEQGHLISIIETAKNSTAVTPANSGGFKIPGT